VGIKQTGDWRNVLIVIGFVKRFSIDNITIKNTHCWGFSFERTLHAKISNIVFNSPEEQIINGKKSRIYNRDGIDLRQGCKFFRIENISGITGDDFIALSNLGSKASLKHQIGDLHSTMITPSGWRGSEDDI